jgi:hypothetical protein
MSMKTLPTVGASVLLGAAVTAPNTALAQFGPLPDPRLPLLILPRVSAPVVPPPALSGLDGERNKLYGLV